MTATPDGGIKKLCQRTSLSWLPPDSPLPQARKAPSPSDNYQLILIARMVEVLQDLTVDTNCVAQDQLRALQENVSDIKDYLKQCAEILEDIRSRGEVFRTFDRNHLG